MRILVLFTLFAAGCGKGTPPTDPQPVQLDRKFFDEQPAPGVQGRPLPQPDSN